MYSFCIFLECDGNLDKLDKLKSTLDCLEKIQDFKDNGKLVIFFKHKRYMLTTAYLNVLNTLLYKRDERLSEVDDRSEVTEISECVRKDEKDIILSEGDECIFEADDLEKTTEISEKTKKNEKDITFIEVTECFFGVDDPGKITEIMECIEKDKRDIYFFASEGDLFDPYCFKYIDSFFKVNSENCGVMFIPALDCVGGGLPVLFQEIPSGGIAAFDESFTFNLRGAAVLSKYVREAGMNNEPCYENFGNILKHIAKQHGQYGIMNKTAIWRCNKKTEGVELKTRYLVSCIIPIYNVERYLSEAIDSVIAQTIGFEENVQLILVNDGSPDNCSEICHEYADKYPNNVVYIEQENKGVSAARNAGLDAADGEFAAFLDGDDRYDKRFFEVGIAKLGEWEGNVDFVAFPLRLFGSNVKDENHPLNYRFKESKIVDVTEQPEYVHLFCPAMIIRLQDIGKERFNKHLRYAEDVDWIHRILQNKMKYGVVAEPVYNYRRGEENSAITKSYSSIYWYEKFLTLYRAMIERDLHKFGEVTEYTQYLIMYDIQWYKISKIPDAIIADVDKNKLFAELRYILQFIGREIIVNQKNISYWLKCWFLCQKYGNPELRSADTLPRFYFGDEPYEALRGTAWVTCVEEYDGEILITGSVFLAGFENIDVAANYNNKFYHSDIIRTNYRADYYIGEPVAKPLVFDLKLSFDCNAKDEKITFYLFAEGFGYFPLILNYTYLSRMRNKPGAFVLGDKSIIHRTDDNSFNVEGLSYESLKNAIEGYVKLNYNSEEYAADRCLISDYLRLYHLFSKERIWLFMDRRLNADDNAEALFKFCNKMQDGIDKYFVISEDSVDYARLCNEGNILRFGSNEHKLMHLFCEKYIASDFVFGDIFPFGTGKQIEMFQCITKTKFIFLQHGVTKDDMSQYFARFKINPKMFVTSAQSEYRSILEGDYGYDEKVVKLTGFPRFDLLYNNPHMKQIVFIPTWRNELTKGTPNMREYNPDFVNSELYAAFDNLLCDKRLIHCAKQHGYELLLRPHPHMYIQAEDFTCKMIPREKSYRDIYAEASLMVTDYSSAVFDFAYLKKPVLYYHFEGRPLGDGYFDYRRDGFGEVVSEHDELVDLIVHHIENGCVMAEEYTQRVDGFFKYTDRRNCDRVYHVIKELCKN